ncbi:hypothetical protein AB4874_19205 [Thioclava sp. 15-R06ZXC-3]|uniref:Uncharacterized protein n=1 Tax=Thioclava arctica TaxID=3238301 RepID=A0ABV3TQ32_9RHOB
MQEVEIENGAAKLTALFNEAGLCRIAFDGSEMLRGLSAPVRDTAWGEIAQDSIDCQLERVEAGYEFRRKARICGNNASVSMTISLLAEGDAFIVAARFLLQAEEPLVTNRAGFCLLHPLFGLRGTPLFIVHPDGSETQTEFPTAIAPAQVARDVAAMRYTIAGVQCDIDFAGEVFEMEDQRNWSDASFKTYCRPLGLPVPIRIEAGKQLEQTVEIVLRRQAPQHIEVSDGPLIEKAVLPAILLAVEPGWIAKPSVRPLGYVMREKPDNPFQDADLKLLAELVIESSAPLDLEFVVAAQDDPQEALSAMADRLARFNLSPRHVIALPEAYLKSYQPDGEWPPKPGPEDAAKAARQAFPKARIGCGMLTYFTEFNRCPPPENACDYVTYGTSAIVHAADSSSVFQTLEALPDIFKSADAISTSKPQRLGLVAIAMRSNPYGASLAENPDGLPHTMTANDRRHSGDAGAAFAAAAVMLAAECGIEALCIAAPKGPFGLVDHRGTPTPLAKLIEHLQRFWAEPVEIRSNGNGRIEMLGKPGRLTAIFAPEAAGLSFEEDDS